ncbi:SETMR methyltransferase, partial [Pseudoatta argentina]
MKGLMKEIKVELDNVHSISTPAFTTVYNWVNEFKRDRTSTCDASRSERPIEAAMPEIIDKVLCSVIRPFQQHLKKKRPHLAKKKVLFHQNNAFTSPAPMAKFNKFRYELLPHPAYLSDFTPCDYFLFPNLKKWFGGKRFTREQLIAETEAYFEELDKSYYSDLKKLDQVYQTERRLNVCGEIKMNR